MRHQMSPVVCHMHQHKMYMYINMSHAFLYIVKDAIGKSLDKPTFQSCSTPAKPASTKAFYAHDESKVITLG